MSYDFQSSQIVDKRFCKRSYRVKKMISEIKTLIKMKIISAVSQVMGYEGNCNGSVYPTSLLHVPTVLPSYKSLLCNKEAIMGIFVCSLFSLLVLPLFSLSLFISCSWFLFLLPLLPPMVPYS